MIKKSLPIGVEDFEELQDRNCYFIDKTLLIKDLKDMHSTVNLFTRPRRFGKTLNMSMLKYFYEIPLRGDKKYLFENLKIWQEGERYTSEQGKYPVISLSLKSAEGDSFEEAFQEIKKIISKEYKRHNYLLNNNKMLEVDKKYFSSIQDKTAEDFEYKSSICDLSEYLEKHYNQKVIILIDEYDVPLQKAYINGYYDKMIGFIRSLLSSALKTNNALNRGILTGCLKVSQESIFTGLNNLKTNSILSAGYTEYFGFTQIEVDEMLKYYSLEEKTEEVKQWYNGYRFGKDKIYNPWSIINYVDEHNLDFEIQAKPYWSNTSSNDIVRRIIDFSGSAEKEELEILISGGTIEKEIHENVTYGELDKNTNNLWNFMFFTGYLTVVSEYRPKGSGRSIYELKIPNEEILDIYKSIVRTWFKEILINADLSDLYKAIVSGDADKLKKIINKFLMKSISYHDYKEDFYHGTMVGLLSGMQGYRVKSNRESGTGRFDMVAFDEEGITAVIFEFKCLKDANIAQMDEECKNALLQIEENQYENECRDLEYESIIKYGITFSGKRCRVMQG